MDTPVAALLERKGSAVHAVPSTITDSTGGTASTTFAAITAGASYSQADMTAVKNALSQVAVNLNAMNTAFGLL